MSEPWVVLIVGDAGPVAQELAAAFEGAGATVVRAADAFEASQTLLEQSIDVAVVDLELPLQSGLAVLQHVRQTEQRGHLPVLMRSLTDDVQARVAAFAEGADDFLVKPVAPLELVARAQRHLALRRRFDGLARELDRLRELSSTDGLTQVANHRAFQERLKEEFRRAQRYDDPLALILMDVDHFKLVNDSHGHQVGDEVLKAMAQAVRDAVRETDLVARYGGEEFAVLLPKTHLAGALTVAERICADVRGARVRGFPQLKVTASLGVSSFPARAVTTAELLVKTADDALYRAKREGRNKISLYQASAFAPLTSNG
jgi:diguanylate cyclase (GGDEF)-like protein